MSWLTGRRRPKPAKRPLRRRIVDRLLRLPPGLLERLGGGPVEVDGRRLDPIYPFLLRFAGRGPKAHEMEPEETRRLIREKVDLVRPAPLLMDRVEDRRIDTPGGRITVRTYQPPNLAEDPAPAVVFFHGGGWVHGDLESHHPLCTLIAQRVPCRLFSVDYRLAPEHPFPAAVDDAVAAYRWVTEHARDLRVDSRRVAVAGDSAGGNLAAVVCQQVRGQQVRGQQVRGQQGASDVAAPCLQMLLYPVTDRLREGGSYEDFAEGLLLDRDTMKWFFRHTTGDETGLDDPKLAPLRADDLSGLPPAIVVTAFFDVLRDEGEEYARALEKAGVEVRHFAYDDQPHAFASMTGVVPSARQAVDEICSELAYRFHHLKQDAV